MSVALSEHLPLLASAPEGIQKLRGLILELAVRGKLVPQDPDDEPASELLKRIAKERARLEIGTTREKNGQTPPSGESGRPFGLPKGWEWERFGEVAEIERGGSPRPIKSFLTDDPDGLNWIKIGDTDIGGKYITSTSEKIRREGLTKTRMVYPGDFLLTNSMSFGRPYITQIKGCIHDGWLRISPPKSLDKDYLYTLLSSPFVRKLFVIAAAGAVVMNLNADKVRELSIPLPPLAEQHRIVAKVDELMALCDRLGAEQADADAAHARLVNTLLGTLTQSADAADLAANWQRLAEHFDALFTTEASLDALKQTILQLAVMGKLVPQDPNDEPASELLTRIAKERAKLEIERAVKKSKPRSLISQCEPPEGWEPATLPDLCKIGGGATPSKAKSAYWGDGLPWVSPKDMKVEHLFDAQDHVTELALSETRLPRISSGSLLIVVRGMILLHSFPVATTRAEVAINQDMKALTPFLPELQPYIALALRGWKPQILELVDRSTHGTCKLQSEKLFTFCFAIPPLAEQHRIVAKVDELMALCDRLKADLAESRARQARLSATLIETALRAA